MQAESRKVLQRLLTARDSQVRTLWPGGFKGPPPLMDRLVSADGQNHGKKYMTDQHVQVNVEGSERYTQSLPGSSASRVSPLDPTLANVTIAGDWTDCGFNGGCVEAAVMSGMLAAHAISNRLDLHSIVGYDHP